MKIILLFLVGATAVFAVPPVETPSGYRDADNATPWQPAQPADGLARGEWWTLFGDEALDELETRAVTANQDLRAAAARVEQARAITGAARSSYWPQVAANGDAWRERGSATTENTLPDSITTTYRAALTASWEIDLFGRVRRLAESA